MKEQIYKWGWRVWTQTRFMDTDRIADTWMKKADTLTGCLFKMPPSGAAGKTVNCVISVCRPTTWQDLGAENDARTCPLSGVIRAAPTVPSACRLQTRPPFLTLVHHHCILTSVLTPVYHHPRASLHPHVITLGLSLHLCFLTAGMFFHPCVITSLWTTKEVAFIEI